MAVEHILGLVGFIVIVLALSLLLPIGSRRAGASNRGDGGASAGGSFGDSGGDCSAADGGGDGGGD
jgi:hypothetical protein